MKEKICGCGCGKMESVVIQDIQREFGDDFEQAQEVFDCNWKGEYSE